jgi:hypothetical protein
LDFDYFFDENEKYTLRISVENVEDEEISVRIAIWKYVKIR